MRKNITRISPNESNNANWLRIWFAFFSHKFKTVLNWKNAFFALTYDCMNLFGSGESHTGFNFSWFGISCPSRAMDPPDVPSALPHLTEELEGGVPTFLSDAASSDAARSDAALPNETSDHKDEVVPLEDSPSKFSTLKVGDVTLVASWAYLIGFHMLQRLRLTAGVDSCQLFLAAEVVEESDSLSVELRRWYHRLPFVQKRELFHRVRTSQQAACTKDMTFWCTPLAQSHMDIFLWVYLYTKSKAKRPGAECVVNCGLLWMWSQCCKLPAVSKASVKFFKKDVDCTPSLLHSFWSFLFGTYLVRLACRLRQIGMTLSEGVVNTTLISMRCSFCKCFWMFLADRVMSSWICPFPSVSWHLHSTCQSSEQSQGTFSNLCILTDSVVWVQGVGPPMEHSPATQWEGPVQTVPCTQAPWYFPTVSHL